MNNKLIFLVILGIISSLSADADFYRDNDGRWWSYDEKTDEYKEIFPHHNISDPRYRERHYPYQLKSDYTTFGSDRTYIDQTNRNMGNNR